MSRTLRASVLQFAPTLTLEFFVTTTAFSIEEIVSYLFVSADIYAHTALFFSFRSSATLFHSRNWLWTRWPIKSATATARTRIKIAAFLEAR